MVSGFRGRNGIGELAVRQVFAVWKAACKHSMRCRKLPAFTDYSMQHRTYRYTQENILYPFGYGLTYGTVVCTDLHYENGIAVVTAENQGSFDTER